MAKLRIVVDDLRRTETSFAFQVRAASPAAIAIASIMLPAAWYCCAFCMVSVTVIVSVSAVSDRLVWPLHTGRWGSRLATPAKILPTVAYPLDYSTISHAADR